MNEATGKSDHRRLASTTDAAVQAAGKVTEALETIEQARGHLYASVSPAHRSCRPATRRAVALLCEVGQVELAEYISRELIGRNVLPGRWSFQVIEDYDDGYYRCFQEVERLVRTALTGGRRHVYEAEMKQRRRTAGHPAHSAFPNGEPTKE